MDFRPLWDTPPRFDPDTPRARDIRFSFFLVCSFRISKGEGGAKPMESENGDIFFPPHPRRGLSRLENETKRNETKLAHARSFARSFRRLFSSPSSRSIGYSPPLRRPAETPVLLPFPLTALSPLFLLLHHHHPSPRRIYRWKPEAAIN